MRSWKDKEDFPRQICAQTIAAAAVAAQFIYWSCCICELDENSAAAAHILPLKGATLQLTCKNRTEKDNVVFFVEGKLPIGRL